ncbi:Coenzyme PQQ synthesis protein E [Halioglobus japonicus]|nr:Coenzyme PQQ synthesis protein E [Halioglobus japonicus]
MTLAFHKENRSAFTNFLRSKYEMFTAAERVETLPYYITIDPSDTCQLLCPTCPTGIENESKKQKGIATTLYRSDRKKLSLELFDSLLEELADKLFLIMFYNYGEPLLNQRLHEYIAKATEHNIATEIHSNLSLKLSDERIEQLLTAGVDRLSASIDGFSQKAYEVHRVGGDVSLVHDNLRRLAQTRDRLGLDTEIFYKFLIFKHNEHEIEDARKFAEDIGVQFISGDAFIHDQSWLPSHRENEVPYYSQQETDALVDRWKTAGGREDYFFEHEHHPFWNIMPKELESILPQSCSWHYGYSVVTSGGPVAPCCAVSKDSDDFGTVVPGEVSFSDIWNNEHYTKSRRAMAGKPTEGLGHVDAVCTRCYFPKLVHHLHNSHDVLVVQQFAKVFGTSEPEMLRAFELLGDGFGSADAAGFIAHYEQHLSGSAPAEKIGLKNLEPQPQQSELSAEQATDILKQFGALVADLGEIGSKVYDESLLHHPKDHITAAIVTILTGAGPDDQQNFAREAAPVLAFFQPMVGGVAVEVDSLQSDNTTWRRGVESDMQKIHREIAARSEADR